MSEFKKIYGKKYKDSELKECINIWVRYKDNPRKWVLVKELSFGSVEKPNENILEVFFTLRNERPPENW